MQWRRRLLALQAAVALLGIGDAAAAQVRAAPASDELVVTAQRRPERAQDVPISLTALSGEALDDLQVTDSASLGRVVPSLVMLRTGAFTQPYLRGVGKRSTLGVENSVATYVDGVYLASSIGALLDLRGIERVEVLNGPQGTLFGRNATGGVIQIVTREPVAGGEGEAEVQLGSDGLWRGDVYASGGSDTLAGNFAASLSRNAGYGTNILTGDKDQGEIRHSLVARSKWVWRPFASVRLTLAADYQDLVQDFSQRPLAGYPPIGAPRVQDFRDGDQDGSNRSHFRYGGASLRTEAGVGGVELISLTALRRLRASFGADLDQGPQLLIYGAAVAAQRQVSQEFQFQSNVSSRVAWVAGLYYLGIDERYEPSFFRYGGSYSARLGGRTAQNLYDRGHVSAYAAYGQATLPLGGRTHLTAGLRYTIEQRSVRANGEQLFATDPFVRPIPGLPLPGDPPFRNQRTFREPTWRASLDHHLSGRLMAYVSASRGVQSGGWNLQTPQVPSFAPERLDAFEGGLKFVDRSGRWKAEASLFHDAYSDMQVSAFTPLGSVTTNATSADINGVDVQVSVALATGPTLIAGAQWLDARFNRFPNATCTNYSASSAVPYAPVACDATGNRLPFAPRFKFNAGARHLLSLRGSGALLLSANLAYASASYSEVDNVVRQHGFATFDASAEWRPKAGGPSLRLWAINLTDAHHHDSLVTFPTAGVLQRPAAPRRFGIAIAQGF